MRAIVEVTAFNSDGYSKRIARLSDVQVHSNDMRVTESSLSDTKIGGICVTVDPKKFPEMDRFVVSVEVPKQ